LAVRLNESGIAADIAGQHDERMDGQADAKARWLSTGVPAVHWLGMGSRLGIVRAVGRLRRLIREEHYDVIVTSTIGTGIVAQLATRMTQSAHVVALHSDHPASVLHQARFRAWIAAARRADAFYSISEFVRNRATALRIPSDRNRVIYNSVEEVSTPRRSRSAIRTELGIPEDAELLLYVGRVVEDKGCVLLVEVLASALRRRGAYLVMIGAASRHREAERGNLNSDRVVLDRAREHGVADRVLVLGFRNDAREIMTAADVVVHLPRHEGFGLVLVEAIAAGVPIVASDVGGIPEVLVNTPYSPMSLERPNEIADAVEKWLDMDPRECELICARARRVLPYYLDGRRAQEVVEVLEAAIRWRRTR
jgi:glycosyltransferase involved in cell wall biosynthesis